jgi:hypothetical protein
VIEGGKGSTAEVATDPRFEQRWNVAQRLTQALIALVVFCGLAGGFGSGWLAHAQAHFSDPGITISYDMLLRSSAPGRIELDVDTCPDRKLIVHLNRDYLEHVSIGPTEPHAAAVEARTDGTAYTFDLGPERRGRISIPIKPRDFGPLTAEWSVGGQPVTFHQFVFP